MKTVLSFDCYGKSSVRFAKIIRQPHYHDFKEVNVNIQLEGDFAAAYIDGDNRNVLPTDTMKNTVYVLAQQHALQSVEAFGQALGEHFLQHNPQVACVRIALAERLWQRVAVSSADQKTTLHPHTFVSAGNEKWTSKITMRRDQRTVAAGIENLLVLKTTDSGFENFIKDQYTTLPETRDRILASDVNLHWHYASANIDFNQCRQIIRQAVLDTFAQHYSYSVQQTIYLLGKAVLEKCAEVTEINLVMPNKHYIPFDLSRFGLTNRNEIFVPTEEPFGRIEGTLKRSAD